MKQTHRRTPRLLALAACAPTLAAALPAPSDDAHVLYREGDTLSNGETGLFFGDYRIANNGSWAAIVGSDGPAVLGFGRELLLRDGEVILAEGDALPTGAIVHEIAGMELSPDNDILAHISILPPGAPARVDAIWFGGITILRAGPISGPGIPAGATLDDIVEFEVTAQGQLLVLGRASLGGGAARDVVLHYDFTGGPPVITVEVLSGHTIAPFTDPIDSLPAFARSFDAVSDGSYVLPLELDRGALPVQAGVASGVAVYADGDPTPLPNAEWDLVDRPSMCAGPGGDHAVGGRIRSTLNGSVRGVVLRNGVAVAVEGGGLNGILGGIVRPFAQPTLDMAETGELFFQVPIGTTTTTLYDALMVDSEMLIRTGTSTASGETIEGFGGASDSLRVSPDGNHCLFHAFLPGNVEAVCAIERRVGGDFPCSSAPNSTGVNGRLFAEGSSFIAANDLEVTAADLPTDTFGYLCLSITPGFIANPGGSVGNLCLGGEIGRYVDQVQSSGVTGAITTSIDLTSFPQPMGAVGAQPGEVWGFQMWHRDASPGGPVSNWTNPMAIRLR